MGVHHKTERWVTCDKCRVKVDNTREDLIPAGWAKIFVEEAPEEYPTDDMRAPFNYKWDDIIKLCYSQVLCKECYEEYRFLFVKRRAKRD